MSSITTRKGVSMSAHTPTTSTVGDNLHRRAEALLGKRGYSSREYMDALVQAEDESRTAATVADLAQELLREHPKLGSLEAARVLAEARLGLHREPDDSVQATAERLARSRGTSIEAITDYRELSELYQRAERVLTATEGGTSP
jgi:hypothetical protein